MELVTVRSCSSDDEGGVLGTMDIRSSRRDCMDRVYALSVDGLNHNLGSGDPAPQ